jgi:hypothetical protein
VALPQVVERGDGLQLWRTKVNKVVPILNQALHHEGVRGSECIDPHKETGELNAGEKLPVDIKAGEDLATTRTPTRRCPARSRSLYRLRCRGS